MIPEGELRLISSWTPMDVPTIQYYCTGADISAESLVVFWSNTAILTNFETKSAPYS